MSICISLTQMFKMLSNDFIFSYQFIVDLIHFLLTRNKTNIDNDITHGEEGSLLSQKQEYIVGVTAFGQLRFNLYAEANKTKTLKQ